MRAICSVDVVRTAEARAGVPEPVLMQRASHALAGVCRRLLCGDGTSLRGRHVVALVGTGNNGGDALWALSMLAGRGARTTVVGDPAAMHVEGARAARAAGARVVGWTDPAVAAALGGADLVLDGILGIGGRGGIRQPAAAVVELLAGTEAPVVAVDVPSGVDAGTGEVAGVAVTAHVTVCFGVLKPGLVLAPGRDHAGALTVVDIGLVDEHLEPVAHALSLADLAIARPAGDAHKYRRGLVGVSAGSIHYPGAALLAVDGARMAGAGMVVLRPAGAGLGAGSELDPVGAMVVARHPDVVVSAERPVDACCIGPGLGDPRACADRVLSAMADPAPLVLDASALDVLARQDGRTALAERSAAGRISVLTPHAGEFSRLGFDTAGGRLACAQRAARDTGAVLVLKGPGTVVAAPDGTAFIDTFADAQLATAGSGDVLAGLLAGMLAAAVRAGELNAAGAALVAARAVGLHGLAGRRAGAGGGPVTATDIAEHLRGARAAASAAAT